MNNKENKYKLYDNIVASSILNIKDFSKRTGMIILNNFEPTNKKHLFILNAAEISKLYSDVHREIYLIMPLFKYLWFKFKNRKRYEVKLYNNSLHKSEFNIIINMEEVLRYIAEAYEIDIDDFDKIYDEYYL